MKVEADMNAVCAVQHHCPVNLLQHWLAQPAWMVVLDPQRVTHGQAHEIKPQFAIQRKSSSLTLPALRVVKKSSKLKPRQRGKTVWVAIEPPQPDCSRAVKYDSTPGWKPAGHLTFEFLSFEEEMKWAV
ncbi:MAG: hypothetical protein ACUVRU_13245 [Anaerolineae bacterium]